MAVEPIDSYDEVTQAEIDFYCGPSDPIDNIPDDSCDNRPESATGCMPPDDDTVADGWRNYGGSARSDNH